MDIIDTSITVMAVPPCLDAWPPRSSRPNWAPAAANLGQHHLAMGVIDSLLSAIAQSIQDQATAEPAA